MPLPVKVRKPPPPAPAVMVAPPVVVTRQSELVTIGPAEERASVSRAADVVQTPRYVVGNGAMAAALGGVPPGGVVLPGSTGLPGGGGDVTASPGLPALTGLMLLAGQDLGGNGAVAATGSLVVPTPTRPAGRALGSPPGAAGRSGVIPPAPTAPTASVPVVAASTVAAPEERERDRPDASAADRPDLAKGSGAATAAGRSAGSDPKFQALTKDVAAKKRAVGSSHPPAKAEAGAAQAAAVAPADDRQARGKAAHAEDMNAAQPKEFDRAAFIRAVEAAIARKAPRNLDEADKFGDSGKAEEVRAEVQGEVGEGKDASAAEIATTTAQVPAPAGDAKVVVPLGPDQPPGRPAGPDPDQAAPDRLPASATDMSAGPQLVDRQMAGAQVTEAQMARSNEPTFKAALANKDALEAHSATAPGHLRGTEAQEIKAVKTAAGRDGSNAMASMIGTRVDTGRKVGAGKTGAKERDEDKRARVTAILQSVYDRTKLDVEAILSELDRQVDKQFTVGEKLARDKFTTEHTQGMRRYKKERYSQWNGGWLWLKDRFLPLPEEANRIYERARDNYLAAMRRVIAGIATTVETQLRRAKDRIAAGRGQLQAAVRKLPADLRAIGTEAAAEFTDRFAELADTVNAKGTELVDTLATRYTDAVKAVDAEIAAEKEKNRGLLAKAADAVKGVVNTIIELKNMLLGVLRKAAQAIGAILADPIGFLGNLVSAVGGGLRLFLRNVGRHLQQGVLSWLLGTASSAGLQIPARFDVRGIVTMIAGLLGLTWGNIRSRITRKVPDEAVTAAETAVPLVAQAKKQGVAGMWEDVKARVGDLKKDLIDRLVKYLTPTIIIAGITWILSLLNPASAFVRACKMIIDIVRFIVTQGRQIIEFVNSVLDAVLAIARGGAGGVPALVEGALARSIPVLIGALAAILGIGGIAGRVRQIFQELSRPVNRAIDWVVDKIVGLVKKLWAKLKAALDRKKRPKPKRIRDRGKPRAPRRDDWNRRKTPPHRGKDRRDRRSEQEKQRALDAAVHDATRLISDESATVKTVRRGLPQIKKRHGLTRIHLVQEFADRYFIELTVNPQGRTPAEYISELAVATRTATGDVDPAALRRLMDSLPVVPVEADAMRRFAGRAVGSADAITLAPVDGEGARGVSGAPVYLIRSAKREIVGVLKIFPKPEEFARELSALVRLGRLRIAGGRAVSPLGVARTTTGQGEAGMLVSSAARGRAIDQMMLQAARSRDPERRASFGRLRQAVEANARALAGLHTAEGSGGTVSPAYMRRHVDAMTDIASKLQAKGALLAKVGINAAEVRRRADELITQFQANPGGSAIVHGDAHPGNFFYDQATGITMIDTPTLHYSMDAHGSPIGAPARDVANFGQKLANFGLTFGLTSTEIAELQAVFRQSYVAGGGARVPTEADAFFRARTALGELIRAADGVEGDISSGRPDQIRALQTQAALARDALGLRSRPSGD